MIEVGMIVAVTEDGADCSDWAVGELGMVVEVWDDTPLMGEYMVEMLDQPGLQYTFYDGEIEPVP